jgi:hypothetical protein
MGYAEERMILFQEKGLAYSHIIETTHNKKKTLRGFGPLANYADRPSDRRFLAK